MDIAGLSTAMSQTELLTNISTAVMSMSLDTVETAGAETVEMLEKTVQPDLGQNIDIKL